MLGEVRESEASGGRINKDPGPGDSRLRPREREATAPLGCHGEPRRRSGDKGKCPAQLAATAPVQAKDNKGSAQGASLGECMKWQDLGWLFERTPL